MSPLAISSSSQSFRPASAAPVSSHDDVAAEDESASVAESQNTAVPANRAKRKTPPAAAEAEPVSAGLSKKEKRKLKKKQRRDQRRELSGSTLTAQSASMPTSCTSSATLLSDTDDSQSTAIPTTEDTEASTLIGDEDNQELAGSCSTLSDMERDAPVAESQQPLSSSPATPEAKSLCPPPPSNDNGPAPVFELMELVPPLTAASADSSTPCSVPGQGSMTLEITAANTSQSEDVPSDSGTDLAAQLRASVVDDTPPQDIDSDPLAGFDAHVLLQKSTSLESCHSSNTDQSSSVSNGDSRRTSSPFEALRPPMSSSVINSHDELAQQAEFNVSLLHTVRLGN